MSAAHESAHRWLDRASDAVRNTAHQPLPTNPGELYDYLGVLAELTRRLDGAVQRLTDQYDGLLRVELRSDDDQNPYAHILDVLDELRHEVTFGESALALDAAHAAASHLAPANTPGAQR